MCGLVERYFPKLEPTMREAKLFWWPGKPEDLPKNRTDEENKFLGENFFLPFKTIAIEDSISCVIIQDIETDQRGVTGLRKFAECMKISDAMVTDSREARTHPEHTEGFLKMVRGMNEEFGEIYVVTFGKARLTDFTTEKSGIFGEVDGSVYFLGDRVKPITPADPFWAPTRDSALKNFMTAIEEVTLFNAPNRFVVEERHVSARPPQKAKKIPRSHDRPKYTLLTKKEVQVLLDVNSEDSQDRQHPSAHWRRRHYRTFRSEHWKNVLNKTIVIPACWVGPSEKQIGNKIYKVCLDL